MSVTRFGPTRRGGPVFRWLGEHLALDFANTVMVVRQGEEIDLIGSADDLGLWLREERERLGHYAFDPADAGAIRELRDAVRGLLGAAARDEEAPRATLRAVNAASAAAPVSPQLVSASAGMLDVEVSVRDRGSLGWLLGVLARAAINLLVADGREPLRVCEAPSCGMFFLGARRWCCAACGNRARAARHYQRSKSRRS
jgi:predicted RNA-binding Zn ribbon-like protein